VKLVPDERGRWRASPAYDLTFSAGPGGEHSMLVGGAGADPAERDLFELAASVDLRRPHAIIEEVRDAVARFERFADQAGLPKAVARRVSSALRAGTSPSTRRR